MVTVWGVVTLDQADPFHSSLMLVSRSVTSLYTPPTARHQAEEMQETP